LQASFTVEHVVIHVDASIGIAMCPDAGTTVAALLQRADIAMYGAKLDRIGGLVYEVGDNDDLTTRLRLIHELRAAIDEGQLVLHYQPKLDLRTGEIDGTEALVRWNHPQHGLLFPDKFIGEAERYGFMRRLTAAVLAMALDQAQAWHQIGIDTTIAVNVSASNLLDTELPEQIRSMLEVRALSADSLMVEITETTLMMDPTRSLHVLHELHELGVRISVDDYGTGYSSLGRLRDLPVSELKLDRSFVAGLHSDARSTAIVESTIQLAHALGLILVAEGIETPQQAMLLTRLGCDIGQGYHLGRPVPADELTSRLRSTSAVMSVI
jgi:predicted signal transduction protein with EAL and GGDEF domain